MKPSFTYNGKIFLEIGPMWSGKSTTILRALDRNIIAKKKCLLIKNSLDTRYDGKTINHSGHEYSGFDIVKLNKLSDIDIEKIAQYDVIGVDELQFFPDPLELVKWANIGKIIFAAGLDAKSDLTEFGELHKLIPHCENVNKNQAVCINCGQDASFTKRITSDTSDILVGGKESYISVCRRCYYTD